MVYNTHLLNLTNAINQNRDNY